ncbi:MAG TPA: SET domain-containing protein-lysine N-methyltransferase [Gemmatimonadaceae bacterium]|nr:SET domain-containing protein-lysine N-methyltransferase [Gemmatimonadaceae bacterium]
MPTASKKKAARKRSPANKWLVLRRSRIHGRGVYARADIPKGTRLIEYTGERISNAEADRRYDDESMKSHHTFLFILNNRTCIDAASGGNISRFINHKCDPNCVAWIEGQHIWIDALRDIPQGEELGYDYEFDFLPGYKVEDLEFYGCRCGSPKCRGTIVDVPKSKRHLLQELKRRRTAREASQAKAAPRRRATTHR